MEPVGTLLSLVGLGVKLIQTLLGFVLNQLSALQGVIVQEQLVHNKERVWITLSTPLEGVHPRVPYVLPGRIPVVTMLVRVLNVLPVEKEMEIRDKLLLGPVPIVQVVPEAVLVPLRAPPVKVENFHQADNSVTIAAWVK